MSIDMKTNSFCIKRVDPRYVTLNEDIFMSLPGDCLKVYLALRFEADYEMEYSSVKRNVQFLANKSLISVRQVKYCLKKLEEQGLIMREKNPGYQTTYWVAKNLNNFVKVSVVQEVHGVVQEVHGVVQEVHDINNNSFINHSNKDICTSVPEMQPAAPKEEKPKPTVTKEVAQYVTAWNQLASKYNLNTMGSNQRELKAIEANLRKLKPIWDCVLTPESFVCLMEQAAILKHDYLIQMNFELEWILREKNFMKIYKDVERAGNERPR